MHSSKIFKYEISTGFFGIFAKEEIKAGEMIFSNWNDNCRMLTLDQVKKLPRSYRTTFERYSTEVQEYIYVGPSEDADIDAHLDYFVNHCCDPNCWMVNDGDVAARRDIKAGEQITIDYATFIINEFPSSKIKQCLCGASNCRGKLSKNDWWKLRDTYRGHFLTWIEAKINQREERRLPKIPKAS